MKKYSLNSVPTETQKELSERFKTIRKSKKITQSDLVKRSGVSLGSVKRFEQSGQISLESLLKLAYVVDRLSDFDFVFKIREDLEAIEKLFSK